MTSIPHAINWHYADQYYSRLRDRVTPALSVASTSNMDVRSSSNDVCVIDATGDVLGVIAAPSGRVRLAAGGPTVYLDTRRYR